MLSRTMKQAKPNDRPGRREAARARKTPTSPHQHWAQRDGDVAVSAPASLPSERRRGARSAARGVRRQMPHERRARRRAESVMTEGPEPAEDPRPSSCRPNGSAPRTLAAPNLCVEPDVKTSERTMRDGCSRRVMTATSNTPDHNHDQDNQQKGTSSRRKTKSRIKNLKSTQREPNRKIAQKTRK